MNPLEKRHHAQHLSFIRAYMHHYIPIENMTLMDNLISLEVCCQRMKLLFFLHWTLL